MDSTLSTRVTMQSQAAPENNFVAAKLPWLAAAGALVIYLVTLNRWISFSNMSVVARSSGWLWQQEIYGPLYWLLTFRFRWLPPKAIPFALNFFSAVCGALTLALLARSVALLPHDRTHEQRQREKSPFSLLSVPMAWLPPIFAVVVCGFQLSFWEHATSATGEMLDLLLFAYVIRCLLEFRVDARDTWLIRSAFVYGLGMTNNWAMIGFFPAFMMALIWIKGLEFFNLKFLGQMCLAGLAGLLLYLLLPITQSTGDIAPISFWALLKMNLLNQKSILGLWFNNARTTVALLGLTSLVPVFIIGIRWASYFGDTSRLGVALATYMFHFVHALLLGACVWVALDPPVSPRNRGFGIPFLTFYYLGALSIGYFSGYFLLVFRAQADRFRRPPTAVKFANKAAVIGVWTLFVFSAVLLFYRSLPQIRISNGPMFHNFAALVLKSLPTKGAYLLSDDPRRALLVQAALSDAGKAKDYVFLDTKSLKLTDYHRYLKKHYPDRWKIEVPKTSQLLEDVSLLMVVARLAESNLVYYLHPSFGYYFEYFRSEPHGLAYQLQRYPPGTLVAPVATKENISENKAFWTSFDNAEMKTIKAATISSSPPAFMAEIMDRAHLLPHTNIEAIVLASYYSRAADYWGVEMQKAGDLPQAAEYFQRALDLNPDNVVAQVNLDCNKNLQAGHKSAVKLSKSVEDAFGRFRSWDQIMGENGPFDEPNFCFEQGKTFAHTSLYRQAATEFDRAVTLDSSNLGARLWLAQLYVVHKMADQALKIIDEIHAKPELLKVPRTNQTELLYIEAAARLTKGDVSAAERTIEAALQKSPGDSEDVLATATRVYMAYGNYTNAIATLDAELKIAPDNASALVNKGYAYMQMNDYERAIPPLNKALTIQSNDYSALLNRAICYFRAKQYDNAQRDYESLQKLSPTDFRLYYGLGEIAYNKKDTNAAIRNFQLYLTNSPPNNEEAKFVMARLKELKPGTP